MFGLGKIKIIPGTFGSLTTTIFLYFVFHIIKLSPNIVLIGLLVIFIYSFIAVASHIKAVSYTHLTLPTTVRV